MVAMWCSPSLYTRPMGYKLCLVVFAGGSYDTTDTHLSLCLSLMEGEYDENLKWPFREKFAVQLLSQNGDKKYYAKKIEFSASDC